MAFSRRAAFAAPVGIEWVSVNKATSETAFWQAERALLFVANQAAEAAKSAALTAVKGLFTLSAGRKTPYSRKLSSWKARRATAGPDQKPKSWRLKARGWKRYASSTFIGQEDGFRFALSIQRVLSCQSVGRVEQVVRRSSANEAIPHHLHGTKQRHRLCRGACSCRLRRRSRGS
jgi:hypothetical protein